MVQEPSANAALSHDSLWITMLEKVRDFFGELSRVQAQASDTGSLTESARLRDHA